MSDAAIRKRWRRTLRGALHTAARARRVIARHTGTAKPFTMYDSVNPNEIPPGAVAVAGYTSGHWPTYPELVRRFPKARKLSIAVNAQHDATCLDVEPGDATNAQAPGWVRRQQRRGVKRPVLYTSVSNAGALLSELQRNGIRRGEVRLWTAHYNRTPHLCSPSCGFGMSTVADATQYHDKALGRNLDVSLCAPGFLP